MNKVCATLLALLSVACGQAAERIDGTDTDFPEGLVPGKKGVLVVDLAPREQRWIKSSGLSGYDAGEVAIALPEGFTSGNSYPILVTCVTGDRYLDNIEEMDKYWPQAIQEGWIVVTGWADPHPKRDTKGYRRAVTVAAMRKVAELLPESVTWPVAVGGFSGGSKNAAFIAAYLQREGYRIGGLFMGGCNADMASKAMRKHAPDKAAYRQIPVFLSTGSEDMISAPDQSKNAIASMQESGFENTRLVIYSGGHQLHAAHIPIALRWFKEFHQPLASRE